MSSIQLVGDAAECLIVVVGCATCNRPEELARLLESFRNLEVPRQAAIEFVIVDNGEDESGAEAAVARFALDVDDPVHFVRETRRGIPYARNAILEAALARGGRYLCMIDDDEGVLPEWARMMVTGMRQGGFSLAGGPLEPIAVKAPTGAVARILLKAREQRAKELAAEDEHEFATTGRAVDICTNNCCIDLDAVRRTGLRYDPAYAAGGGEDVMFSRAMAAAGEPLGWISGARVIEYLNPRRLTAGFVVRYYRDIQLQSIARRNRSRLLLLFDLVEALGMIVNHVVLFALGDRGHFYWILARSGKFTGIALAIFGVRSRRYAPGNEVLR